MYITLDISPFAGMIRLERVSKMHAIPESSRQTRAEVMARYTPSIDYKCPACGTADKITPFQTLFRCGACEFTTTVNEIIK